MDARERKEYGDDYSTMAELQAETLKPTDN